ncbi:phosphoribosylglycinamide formyltransferase [Amaricoccus solimangrovi]|uniref:Phosphoribosylglycinamide formyltransferase n=1 Tax=Amaricoccus solimangrovi TaxID=2589815 RepID=A0A501WW51_9RHOB|nr:phosphoribosylglycinamide formyltransferase [Amaricoccus solimangrovi]TPE52972.1 phosphoribosylglycinamide formyltransferase [Amaricoccus solimangrovi]
MRKTRVAILISGGGSNMVALTRSMLGDPGHPAEPVLVLSNDPAAKGLEHAAALGVPTAAVDHRPFRGDRAAFEAEMAKPIRESGAELICLAGFMRVLTTGFIESWRGRMLNIHPSILPLFTGLHTHARALEAGMAVHGCTVHEVTPELDAGPILGQAVIPVLPDDTPETLAGRLLPVEHQLYPAVLRRFVAGDRRKLAILAAGDAPG